MLLQRASRDKAAYDDPFPQTHFEAFPFLSLARKRFKSKLRLGLSITALTSLIWLFLYPPVPPIEDNRTIQPSPRVTRWHDRPLKSALDDIPAGYGEHLMEYYRYFPNTNATELAFSQMAFQTRLYAKMLQDDRLSETQLGRYEKDMWSFLAPGIKNIRNQALKKAVPNKRRGIVISSNDGRLKFACQFLAVLRNVYHSTLPVEVYHYGDKEMPTHLRDHITQTYAVKVIDLAKVDLFDKSLTLLETAGWAIKAYALLASEFQEILMADDDSVLLANPDDFFDQSSFINTGTLFFRDRYLPKWTSERAHEFIVKQLRNREPSQMLSNSKFWTEQLWHQQESGIVMVDKSRPQVFAALLFIAWENSAPIRDKITYDYFYGDKESFWLAFELAGFPYHMVSHHAGLIGDEHAEFAQGHFCTDKPLHFFDQNEEAFKKGDYAAVTDPTNTNKTLGLPAWFNGSLRANKHHYLSEDTMMDVGRSIWAIDGDWDWNQSGSCLCLHNYTRGRMSDYGLDLTVGRLAQVGNAASRLLDEVRRDHKT